MPNRWIQFHYEAPEDGGGAVEEPVVEPEVEAPQPEETFAISREDWEATQEYLRATAPLLQQVHQQMQQGMYAQQPQPQAPPEPPAPEFDPFEPESVNAYIAHQIQTGLQQGMQPYQQMFNSIAEQEGQRLAQQQMAKLDSEVGAFDHDAAYMIAAGALADESLDPNQVLSSAARYMHEFEQRVRQEAVEAYKAELQGLQGNPSDPPIGSAAAQETETVPTGPRRYHEAVERALARRNPTSPVG